MNRVFVLAAFGLSAAFSLCAGAAAPAVPTVDEIKQLVKEEKFPDALKKISEALAAPKPTRQYDLYMLRGECHLQSKAPALAQDAFDHAAKQTQELDAKAVALADSFLIKKSTALAYKPTGDASAQPIDIIKPDSRKQAFAALLADQQSANKTKIQQAEKTKKLPPIMDVVDDAIVMLGLELSAKGSATETRTTLTTLLTHAKSLITDTLKTMDSDVDRIDQDANSWRQFTQDQREVVGKQVRTVKVNAWQKKGLSKADSSKLQDYGTTCDKIPPAITVLAQGIKAEQKDLNSLSDQATKVRKQINKLLNEDFSRITHNRPK